MRIISGKYKGRRLKVAKNLPVRPTTDLSKESLFNIINNIYYFDEISVLDLFSGTGNISYEFCSRGTTDITCVDAHAGCVAYIRKTFLDLNENALVIKSDVYKFLENNKQTYNLIFADPPYGLPDEQFLKIADLVFENNLLEEEGVLIIEHPKQLSLEDHPQFSYAKKYGGTVFSFFEAVEE